MLRLLGSICLVMGSVGVGWSWRGRFKTELAQLYEIRQIMKMFQSEITYSHMPLQEACRRISGQVGEPYRGAFLRIHGQMLLNKGEDFGRIWKYHIKECMEHLAVRGEEKRILYDFGESVGFMDDRMQVEILEQLIYKLELAIDRQEKELANKSRVVMSLSVMGGLMIAILLI